MLIQFPTKYLMNKIIFNKHIFTFPLKIFKCEHSVTEPQSSNSRFIGTQFPFDGILWFWKAVEFFQFFLAR